MKTTRENNMENTNVESWFKLEGGRSGSRENQVKYNIAVTVEGWLNGARDEGYEPTTKTEMETYTYECMQKWYNGNGFSTKHKGAISSLHFHGKENTLALIRQFINEYEDLQPYIK